MEGRNLRQIYYYKDHYLNFFKSLKPEVQKKFNWTLQLISTTPRVPSKFFKYITNSNGLYEIRVELGSDIYRVFCFFDQAKLIIVMQGFQKKSQKTPQRQIELAKKLQKEYYDEKEEK